MIPSLAALPVVLPAVPSTLSWRESLRALDAPAPAASCQTADGTVCGFLRSTGMGAEWARTLTGYGDTALRIVLVLAVGVALRWAVRRAITRLTERIASGDGRRGSATLAPSPAPVPTPTPDGGGAPVLAVGTVARERRTQRALTIGSVLNSLSTAVVTGVVALLVFGEVGIDLAPLLAGAGVVGVAVGFGSQALVKDVLSGIFLIAEDQYGVGDVVDLSGAKGTVEAVGLRVTRLRALDGTVWYVRNGEVLRVGNSSQGWSRSVIDVDVPYREDVTRVQQVLAGVGTGLVGDPEWALSVLEEPQVWGVEALTADRVVVRLVVKTVPGEQSAVSRELRRRIKLAFDGAGIGGPVAEPVRLPDTPPVRVPSQSMPTTG